MLLGTGGKKRDSPQIRQGGKGINGVLPDFYWLAQPFGKVRSGTVQRHGYLCLLLTAGQAEEGMFFSLGRV